MEINMNNMNGFARKLASAAAACLVTASLLAIGISDASAGARGGGGGRAGGGGGGRMAQSSVSGANRSMSSPSRGGSSSSNRPSNGGNNSGNRGNGNNVGNGNRVNNGNINVGNNVNVDIDGGYNNGCCRGGYNHPIAAGVAIGAIAVTTAAVMGSYYYALPPSGCSIVYRNGISYHYCGSVYYQQSYSGNDVVYVVVTP
jgi:hypothetical protein